MLVTISNSKKGLAARFSDDTDIEKIFGYRVLQAPCYPGFVQKNLTFRAYNWQGFFGNNVVTPYSVKGVNVDGENFKANNFEAKTISFEFANVIEKGNNLTSPNNYLNTLLLEKNDTIHVTVQTDQIYENDFYVTENTNTEVGAIELTTANETETGIFWKSGYVTYPFYFFSNYDPKIPMTLPEVMLKNISYPFVNTVFSAVMIAPIIKFGGSKKLGVWSNLSYKDNITGDTFYYDNSTYEDEYITVDSINFTVVNQDGVDRTSEMTFSNFYPIITNGATLIEWEVNGNHDYMLDSEFLPSDMRLEVKIEKLVSGVE